MEFFLRQLKIRMTLASIKSFCFNREIIQAARGWLARFALMASSLSFIYTVPFFAENHEKIQNSTLAKLPPPSYLNETFTQTYQKIMPSVAFRLIFFAGFASSQFVAGFLAEKFGHNLLLKITTRLLIISGFLSATTSNVYLFSVVWFCVAFSSTASYLLCFSHGMDVTERLIESKKWRFAIRVLFQFSWEVGRFLSNLVIYGSGRGNWQAVMMILSLTLTTLYFLVDNVIWNEDPVQPAIPDEVQVTLLEDLQKNPALRLNFMILSLIWLTLGYNYYGTMNSWTKFNEEGRNLVFEYNVLATMLAIVSKLCAIAICLSVARSNLPMGVLQFCCSIAYFIMISLEIQKAPKASLLFVTQMSTFLESATFALIWIITPTMFPKSYR